MDGAFSGKISSSSRHYIERRLEEDVPMTVRTPKRIFVYRYLLFLVGLLLASSWFAPQFFVVALIIILIASLVAPLFWLFLWKLPQWQVEAVPEIKDRIDLESKSRQTMAQILGGAVLLVGLYFTSQTLYVSQQGQITDRFTKAIDQLGKDNMPVRLGGIYALERIAKDSEYDHWAVMEVLTAFIREQVPVKDAGDTHPLGKREEDKDQKIPELRTDIQAILTVLGRRTRTYKNGETQSLNLRKTQLQGADLRGAQLQKASLEGAQLQKASLEGAQLQKAQLWGAQLQKASLWDARLQGAYLGGAQLQGAHLARARFQGADLGTIQLRPTNLEGVDFTEVKGLTQEQINVTCGNESTKLPAGFIKPQPCPLVTPP
jgi:hypothetical protein